MFKVLSIEVNHSDGRKIDEFMKNHGYVLKYEYPPPPRKEVQDHIYVLKE